MHILIKLKLSLLAIVFFQLNLLAAKPKLEFYQLRIYSIKNAQQAQIIDQYLAEAYIPAMHRMGIQSIGVFKPVAADTASFGKKIYVLTPIKSMEQILKINEKLTKDMAYQVAAKAYLDAPYTQPPYQRFEDIILKAFPDAPILKRPNLTGSKADRIYELRSYEGHTEKIHQNKVKMFNAGGEVKLFEKLNFNAIFYGTVIAGGAMPNLMYMTSFENKADRDEHWKAFGSSPEWTKLKVDPEYLNNMSKNTQYFLFPTEYSDY